jgi:hypothetical protein
MRYVVDRTNKREKRNIVKWQQNHKVWKESSQPSIRSTPNKAGEQP